MSEDQNNDLLNQSSALIWVLEEELACVQKQLARTEETLSEYKRMHDINFELLKLSNLEIKIIRLPGPINSGWIKLIHPIIIYQRSSLGQDPNTIVAMNSLTLLSWLGLPPRNGYIAYIALQSNNEGGPEFSANEKELDLFMLYDGLYGVFNIFKENAERVIRDIAHHYPNMGEETIN